MVVIESVPSEAKVVPPNAPDAAVAEPSDAAGDNKPPAAEGEGYASDAFNTASESYVIENDDEQINRNYHQSVSITAEDHSFDDSLNDDQLAQSSTETEFFSEYGDASRYKIQEVIGKGNYGVVCSAIDTHTGEKVAIKKIHDIFEHISDAASILREIKLLRLLRHPDIVEIKHIMLPPSRKDFKDIYVVFELMESDLHQVIKANDDLTKEHYQFFLYQLLRALKYIHTANVYHRDLKPKHILANANCKLKVCDFRLARVAFNDTPTTIFWTNVATRWYRAPELCGSFFSKYTPAIDIWSIGCIFAEVLTGKPLFPGKNVVHQLDLMTDMLGTPSIDTISGVRNEKARRYLTTMRKKQPVPLSHKFPNADPLALRLLQRLLAFDPKDRPTAEEALADPYFKGISKVDREPSCQPISKMEFEFERRRVTKDDIRELIFREILEYHPKLLKDYVNGTKRTNFLYPSAVYQFKKQFAHLEENSGKSGPVIPLERKHASLPRMEVQVDSHLFDISVLLGLMEKMFELNSKFISVRNLKVLNIVSYKLADIPDNINFPDLEELVFHPNLNITYIPPSLFKQMPALKVLDMSNTSIKTLPPVSKWMEKISFRGCELLMELPQEICTLVNLKELDFEGIDLVCLPKEIGKLIQLKCLKLSLYNDESYRRSKDIVAIIPDEALSSLAQLEELSIKIVPHDIWCAVAVKTIIKDLPSLRMLKILELYLPTFELFEDLMELKWSDNGLPIHQTLSNFSFIIGPDGQRFISRLPCDLDAEFIKLKKCLKYVNGEGNMDTLARALEHANALYIDRHWTIQKLSVFKLEELKKLKFCLLVDCNEMHTVFDGSDLNLGVANNEDSDNLSLQYLAIHYLKNLQVIWKGPGVGCCLHSLKVLTLHMCPNLNTIFTKVLLGDLVNLREIIVEDCPKIKTLIADDGSQFTCEQTLPELKKLSLFYLPELVSISSSGISFGLKLENIIIYDCPKLKRFPSLCNEKVVTTIKGEREWWDALEWNEPEWSDGRPNYLGDAFSELDPDGDEVAAPGYENSLRRLLVEECNDNLKSEDPSMKLGAECASARIKSETPRHRHKLAYLKQSTA